MSQLFVKVIRCFIHAIGTSDYANAESFLPHVNGLVFLIGRPGS